MDTLVARGPHAVGYSQAMTQFGDEIAGTLTARYDSSPTAQGGQNVVMAPADVDGADGATIQQIAIGEVPDE